MRETIEFIAEEVVKINNTVHFINHGGCGAFALALSRLLSELNIKHEIVVAAEPTTFEYSKQWLESNLPLKPKNAGGVHLAHVLIYLSELDNLMDSNGLLNQGYKEYYHPHWFGEVPIAGTLTIEELELVVKDKSCWNDTFRRRDIPRIKRYMNKIRNKYIRQYANQSTVQSEI